MLLIVGIALVVLGIVDYVIAAQLARSQAASTGGLGASEAPAVSRILRRSGVVTVVVGAVLAVVGLAG